MRSPVPSSHSRPLWGATAVVSCGRERLVVNSREAFCVWGSALQGRVCGGVASDSARSVPSSHERYALGPPLDFGLEKLLPNRVLSANAERAWILVSRCVLPGLRGLVTRLAAIRCSDGVVEVGLPRSGFVQQPTCRDAANAQRFTSTHAPIQRPWKPGSPALGHTSPSRRTALIAASRESLRPPNPPRLWNRVPVTVSPLR